MPGQRKLLEESQEEKYAYEASSGTEWKMLLSTRAQTPYLLTAFLGQAVHSRHTRRISSLHGTDSPGEWVAYAEQTMCWNFLAAKLVKGVWKARKLYQEIAQKNPSTEHLPLRILSKEKKKRVRGRREQLIDRRQEIEGSLYIKQKFRK